MSVSDSPSIPINAADLSVDWLNAVFTHPTRSKDDVFDELHVAPLAEQGWSTQMYRLTAHSSGSATRCFVAKLSSADPASRQFYTPFYNREVRFYTQLGPAMRSLGFDWLPSCWFADSNENGDHILLLDDLGPPTQNDIHAGATLAEALRFIREIAALHAAWWDADELVDLEREFPTPGRRFEAGYRKGLDAGLSVLTLSKETALRARQLERDLQTLWDRQWRHPTTLIHWDTHIGNVVQRSRLQPVSEANPDWFLIDWQNVTVGRGTWDVARFVVLSMTVAMRRRHQALLIDAYASALAAHGIRLSAETCRAEFAVFYRLVFAQQLRFFSATEHWDTTRLAWLASVGPRVVAAFEDAESDRLD